MKNLKLKNKKLFLVLIVTLILVVSVFSTAFAFSDYEKNVAERLYEDLDKEYRITEFKTGSLEYETLKTLEAKIEKNKFKNEEFKVHHIDDKLINAYYIGAGNIMLFEGLLQELNTENQLAGLIAHEIGHAVEEHLTEDLERNLGLSILNLLFNYFTENEYQKMTNIAQNLIANGYSREQEQESDIYAVDLMLRSGYDPDGLIELMKIFKENSHNVKLLEFTQTHPIPESRIEYLKEYIAEQKSKSNSSTDKKENKQKSEKKREKDIEVQPEIKTRDFNNQFISFSYPQNWEIREEKTSKKEIKFKYQLKTEDLKGELFFEDLSQKKFMETTRKQFQFGAIEAEEKGFKTSKDNLSSDKLDIYRLQLNRENELRLKYFISQKNKEQMLKLNFELNKENKFQQQKVIEKLLKSIKYK